MRRDLRARLPERLFSDNERAYAFRHHDPAPRLAARFGAKEAVMKALGVGLGAFKLRDVEVVRRRGGAPVVAVDGKAVVRPTLTITLSSDHRVVDGATAAEFLKDVVAEISST